MAAPGVTAVRGPVRQRYGSKLPGPRPHPRYGTATAPDDGTDRVSGVAGACPGRPRWWGHNRFSSQPAQESPMQKFTTSGPITAVLDIPAGRIQLIAAGPAGATVEIGPADPSKGRDVKLAEQTTAGYSDGVLRITAPAGNRMFGSSGAVEVTVQLPAGSRVEAKAASAQFTTTGQLGDVTFDSSQATVKVDEEIGR